jgi:hypothetical protein
VTGRFNTLQQIISDADCVSIFQNTERGVPSRRSDDPRMIANGQLKLIVRETIQASEIKQVIPANARPNKISFRAIEVYRRSGLGEF